MLAVVKALQHNFALCVLQLEEQLCCGSWGGWAAAALPGLPVVQASSVQFSLVTRAMGISDREEPYPHTLSGEPCMGCAVDRWVASQVVSKDCHLHAP